MTKKKSPWMNEEVCAMCTEAREDMTQRRRTQRTIRLECWSVAWRAWKGEVEGQWGREVSNRRIHVATSSIKAAASK
eukprot:271186-Prorocentrum_lima.AAC.1